VTRLFATEPEAAQAIARTAAVSLAMRRNSSITIFIDLLFHECSVRACCRLAHSWRSNCGQTPTLRFNLCVPERLLRIDRCRTPRGHVAGQQRHSAEKHEHSDKCRRICRGNLEQHPR
jgi:hypothetical protein